MKKLLFVSLLVINFFAFGLSANAGILNDTAKTSLNDQSDATRSNAGFNSADTTSVGSIIASVIKSFLALLGIIFVVLIITAGYKYMTANGDEGKVEEALESIKRAIIGLTIIVAAYAITAFVFKNLPDSASGGSNGAQFSN